MCRSRFFHLKKVYSFYCSCSWRCDISLSRINNLYFFKRHCYMFICNMCVMCPDIYLYEYITRSVCKIIFHTLCQEHISPVFVVDSDGLLYYIFNHCEELENYIFFLLLLYHIFFFGSFKYNQFWCG